MFRRKRTCFIVIINIFIFAVLLSFPVLSRDFSFLPIEIEQISRYTEDRIAFQHIQKEIGPNIENSLASLLIIKDKKIYLIKDGFDSAKQVEGQRQILDTENKLIGDLWANKINSKPDYIRITDRRVEVLKNVSEDFVSRNFGNFYTSIRNSFIQKHVKVFKGLMRDRRESGLVVNRTIVPRPTYIGSVDKPQTWAISVVGKTIDEKVYYAEDADGDGVTETFSVELPDGFNWGYKSGPNIINIYNNKEEDIKQLIGSITHDAYFGTSEEEKSIIETFPKDADIIRDFNLEAATATASATEKK